MNVFFSWPGAFATLKSSLFFIWIFWGLLASSFLNHLLWLLDVKSLGSKFSCTELGLVPQVNTNFLWLPLISVFCYLCFSCSGIFCFLFCQRPIENSSQTGFSFLVITVADLLFQTTSTGVQRLMAVGGFCVHWENIHSATALKTKPSTRMCRLHWNYFSVSQDELASNRESCICNIQWKYISLTSDIPWQPGGI